MQNLWFDKYEVVNYLLTYTYIYLPVCTYHTDHFAILTCTQWAELITTKQWKQYIKWPLTHLLGFMPANTDTAPTIDEGKYTAIDTMHLGVISKCMEAYIHKFITWHTQHNKNTMTNAQQNASLQWSRLKGMAILRANAIAMVMTAELAQRQRQYIQTLHNCNMISSTKLYNEIIRVANL